MFKPAQRNKKQRHIKFIPCYKKYGTMVIGNYMRYIIKRFFGFGWK